MRKCVQFSWGGQARYERLGKCRLAEAACRKDLPELLRFLIDRFKEGFSGAKGGELSLMHVAVQNGSTHVLPNLLKMDSGLVGSRDSNTT